MKNNLYLLIMVNDRLYINGLVQDCSTSDADTLQLQQPYTKPSVYLQYMYSQVPL